MPEFGKAFNCKIGDDYLSSKQQENLASLLTGDKYMPEKQCKVYVSSTAGSRGGDEMALSAGRLTFTLLCAINLFL